MNVEENRKHTWSGSVRCHSGTLLNCTSEGMNKPRINCWWSPTSQRYRSVWRYVPDVV